MSGLFNLPAAVPVEREDEIAPTAESSLEFLQAVYSDAKQPFARRMRAAIAALPFEHPKLAVTASITGGSGIAARLEAAIKLTAEMQAGRVIEGEATISSLTP